MIKLSLLESDISLLRYLKNNRYATILEVSQPYSIGNKNAELLAQKFNEYIELARKPKKATNNSSAVYQTLHKYILLQLFVKEDFLPESIYQPYILDALNFGAKWYDIINVYLSASKFCHTGCLNDKPYYWILLTLLKDLDILLPEGTIKSLVQNNRLVLNQKIHMIIGEGNYEKVEVFKEKCHDGFYRYDVKLTRTGDIIRDQLFLQAIEDFEIIS